MPLQRLQAQLQDIYELNVAHNVDDFLLTSREAAARLAAGAAFRDARERLLIREDPDGVSLSLYLDRKIVEGLKSEQGPLPRGAKDLHDYCLALEGVSHFLYLIWNASHDRAVTLLEMELQAEVDKFVLLRDSIGEGAFSPEGLLQRLFHSVGYAPDLQDSEQRRYRRANRYAEQYCRRLEQAFFRSGNRKELLNDLRRFYRLPQREKLDYIGVAG